MSLVISLTWISGSDECTPMVYLGENAGRDGLAARNKGWVYVWFGEKLVGVS
jgi:hypothetical protein